MRKKVAGFLAMILLVSIFQGISFPTYAAKNVRNVGGYEELNQTILKDNQIYDLGEEGSLKKDEVVLAIPMQKDGVYQGGKYTLEYFVSSNGIDVKQVIFTAEEDAVDKDKLNIEIEVDGTGVLTTSIYLTNKVGQPDSNGWTGLVTGIGQVSFFVKNDILHYSTRGIPEGLLVPFKFIHTGVVGTTPEYKRNVFKGIKGMELLPTHILKEAEEQEIADPTKYIDDRMSIPSLKRIPYAEQGKTKHQAGERPGFVVSFDIPRVIEQGPNGTYGTKEVDDKVRGTLLFKGEYIEGIEPYGITFKLKEREKIASTAAIPVESGEVVKNATTGKLEIYISKEAVRDVASPTQPTKVEHVWSNLMDSSILTTSLTLEGDEFNNIAGEVTKNNMVTSTMGNTYIGYTVKRTSDTHLTFEIAPYLIKERTLKYSIYYNESNKPIQTNTYKNQKDTIRMVINKSTGKQGYRVGVNIGDEKEYNSQIVDIDLDATAIAPYTEITNVSTAYVIPNEKDSVTGQPEAIGIDVAWTAPSDLEVLLKKGPLYYELFINPTSKTEIGDQLVKIFKIELGQNGELIGSVYEEGKKAPTQKDIKVIYDKENAQFKVFGVQIKKRKELIPSEWEKYNWQSLTMPNNYLGNPQYPLFGEENDNPKDPDKIYEENNLEYSTPNIFYFKIRSIYQINGPNPELIEGDMSKEKALAIDTTGNIIPAPEELEADDKSDATSYKGGINFMGVDLDPFIRYMFEPIGISVTPDTEPYKNLTVEQKRNRRNYEIYIYEEQDVPVQSFEKAILFEKDKGTIDFKKAMPASDKLYKTYIEALRAGEVIRIDEERYMNLDEKLQKEEISLLVEGLDPNTPYYVVVRTRVERYKDGKELEPIYSLYTKHTTFTTDTNTHPPIPEDKVPTAPQEFWSVGPAEELKEVLIHWTESEFSKYQEGSIYYELVRTAEGGLGEWDNPQKSAGEIVNSEKNAKVFVIDQKEKFIKELKKGSNTPSILTQPTTLTKQPLPEGDRDVQAFTYADGDLMPNTIYYYYVRTIHKVDNKEIRSEFIRIPVTTNPIEKPINLKVESPKTYRYETTDEAVISFWAPVPQSGKRGEDYDFEVAIRGEGDARFYAANKYEDGRKYKAAYKSEEIIDKQYIKFVYKITELKHGTSYDVKVRIVDKTKSKDTYSAYSETVRFRTDFDEAEQDKEDKYNKYLEQYDKEAEKLKNTPYWLVDTSRSRGVFKYRKSYLDGLLSNGNTYETETLEFKESVTYYFPKEVVTLMKKHNTMLEVAMKDYNIYLRSNSFKDDKDIKKAESLLKDKKIGDYFISMSFYQSNRNSWINGNRTVTPELSVEMEITYSNKEEYLIEEDILVALNKLIEEGRNRLIKTLDKEMDRGIFREEKLKEYIQNELDRVKEEHEDKVNRILKKVEDGYEVILSLQQPMLIVAKGEGTSVEGYYENGSKWEKLSTYQTMGGFASESSQLGNFIFAAKSRDSVLVPTVPGAESLIEKYYLTDFSSFDSYSLKSYVTKEQFYGTMARMIGGRRDSDSVLTLQNRGIKLVMPQNVYQQVRMDEAIYVLMQAYEKMYYKPIQSIAIQNKQQVQNIGAFQPVYRPYVQAAVQLKVVDTQNNRISPSEALTMEQFMKMLVKIMPK